ncbi:MAG: aminotransferase class III-fold pyridoxal phosphate-dependent enzyme [Nitrospira sp.]|nr:aminotransferase class III-fold pyridoxal phosphate-dependent enzyme [Nitrospira sp.]
MSTAIDEIVEGIVSQRIDKDAAIRSFQGLSGAEKNRLLSKLKSKLTGSAEKGAAAVSRALKPIDERSLSEAQREFLAELTARYGRFAPKSKENASKHSQYFVDARKAANLRKSIKSLQFHITYERAEGAYLYDIDGNRYIDITGDNGVNLFGSQPDFIKDAVAERLSKGYPLVGYTEDLFVAAKLFCEITDNERMAFTQSGTEAVMWAVRIARAATQKTKIVIFDSAYHGMSDTVAAVRDHEGNSLAAGLGIPQEYAEQLIVLDYGDLNQLNIIEARADEIAGVLVEPIQASRPQLQPIEYLRELRKLTLEKNIPLIFDEMITGFRVCPRGLQGAFKIKADITTYGKIPGGGMPTGMIAGSAKYMDFVDGGSWGYEDEFHARTEENLSRRHAHTQSHQAVGRPRCLDRDQKAMSRRSFLRVVRLLP